MEAREILASIAVEAAAERIRGVAKRTPLVPFDLGDLGDAGDPRIELRLKLECLQETGSFKARGAWNNVSQLTDEERAAGVIATSSGNHGRALAWAARRAGVHATVVMPADSYPNKIQACRDEEAEVVLAPTRSEAERICAERVAAGAVLVHPYDAQRTIEGAGTVGLEVAEDWPEVDVLVVPVGGGGLIAGSSLAIKRKLGERVKVIGVEPEGAPNMSQALAAGEPVVLDEITTKVQGLCPLAVGERNLALARECVDHVLTLSDEQIFAAQQALVRAGHVVEPAGAAAFAAVRTGSLPAELFEGRGADGPLRVCCVISGGNPDPEQLESIR
ncbi:MAG: pyridoxal-phosphate dependent enzyme [Planctomycetota bacterium]|nr:pyridoxal-phosphate dependent enzyme [Planctomycetota bacterium]